MSMATKDEIIALLTMMEEVYTHREKLSDGAMLIYFRTLADIPFELLEAAALDHLSLCKWFPSVAELRERATDLSLPDVPSALESWEEVQKEIRRVGHDGRPAFENELTQRMVSAMGWRYLCLSENGMVDRAHYLKAYEQLRQREAQQRVRLPEVKALAQKLSVAQITSNNQTQMEIQNGN